VTGKALSTLAAICTSARANRNGSSAAANVTPTSASRSPRPCGAGRRASESAPGLTAAACMRPAHRFSEGIDFQVAGMAILRGRTSGKGGTNWPIGLEALARIWGRSRCRCLWLAALGAARPGGGLSSGFPAGGRFRWLGAVHRQEGSSARPLGRAPAGHWDDPGRVRTALRPTLHPRRRESKIRLCSACPWHGPWSSSVWSRCS
jgi:hypothetical protein